MRVSTSVSRVMGKRPCSLPPRYEMNGKLYCAKHEIYGRAERLKAERDALIGLLDGFTGNAPSPLQWKLACEKAAKLRAALAAGEEKP